MVEANLYQLTAHPLRQALPKLVESIVTRNKRVMVLCADSQQMQECDDLLWSYSQLSFLPHGTRLDPYPEAQPVYITDVANDNANNASVWAFYDIAYAESNLATLSLEGCEKLLLMFDPNQGPYVERLQSMLKERDINYRIFLQSKDGSWNAK